MKYPAMATNMDMNPYYPNQVADALDVLMKNIRLQQASSVNVNSIL